MSSAAFPRDALILAAGLGTRLAPLTDVRAKPAVPLHGEPMIRHIVRHLAAQGLPRIVVNLHHLPETITRILGDGSDLGACVRYSWEQPRVLGSAGGPRLAAPIIGAGRFVIVNGDTLTDLDIRAVCRAHANSGALATLALIPNREPERYGGVVLDRGGAVTGFVPRGAVTNSWHFVGVQVAEAHAFHDVAPGEAASSIGGVYDRLLRERPGAVRGFAAEASFWDIGTVADYWRTSQALAGGPNGISGIGRRTHVSSSAQVTRSILWDDVTVSDRCTVEDCIVTDGVVVPPGRVYRRSVLTNRGGTVTATPFAVEGGVSRR